MKGQNSLYIRARSPQPLLFALKKKRCRWRLRPNFKGQFMRFYFCSVLCLLCFVRVCLYVLRGHLLGKGWPLGSRLWCLLWVCHFPIGILGQVWYLIVSIPDLCNLTYFGTYCICEQWRVRWACTFVQYHHSLCCSHWKRSDVDEGSGPLLSLLRRWFWCCWFMI